MPFSRHRKWLNRTVKGDDHNWVNGIFVQLQEIIESVKPQDNWLLRHKSVLLHTIALGVGAALYQILRFLTYQLVPPMENPSETVKAMRQFFVTYPFFMFLLDWLLKWGLGITWAFPLREWLLCLWPSIEFDFGPEHMKVEKQRRLRAWVVLSSAVLPIVLTLLYDIVTALFSK